MGEGKADDDDEIFVMLGKKDVGSGQMFNQQNGR